MDRAANSPTSRPQTVAVLACPPQQLGSGTDLSAMLIAELQRASKLEILASPVILPPAWCGLRIGNTPEPPLDVSARYGVVGVARRSSDRVVYDFRVLEIAGLRILSSPRLILSAGDDDEAVRRAVRHSIAVFAGKSPGPGRPSRLPQI